MAKHSTTNDDEDYEVDNEKKNQHIVDCLVQQGYTPTLASKLLSLSSTGPESGSESCRKSSRPLTIWIVDNSSSMKMNDGRKLINTKSRYDVRVQQCTRWEELCETITYHSQLSALLELPTKFVLLNPPTTTTTTTTTTGCSEKTTRQEFSIAERGPEWIPDDLEDLIENFNRIEPSGVTPLTDHLRRVYDSLVYLSDSGTKVVVVVATDGKPTDPSGFSSPEVDRDFELALRKVQSRASFVVIRLCTNDDRVIQYYQRLDEQLELQLEVLDDYLDEAKEVFSLNPWLTYSLSLHRCREAGFSGIIPQFRVLDWLDERPLSREEIVHVMQILGIIIDTNGVDDRQLGVGSSSSDSLCVDLDGIDVYDEKSWKILCQKIGNNLPKEETQWNPITKRPTPLINVKYLRSHGSKNRPFQWLFWVAATLIVGFLSIAIQLGLFFKTSRSIPVD